MRSRHTSAARQRFGRLQVCRPTPGPRRPSRGRHRAGAPDQHGDWRFVGYLLQWQERRLYHAGDTALTDQVFQHLSQLGPIDFAFLPVNEINYFRNRRGIIGNMSIREAFGLADELGISCVIPTHWDMFAANQVYREEIELLYEKLAPSFALKINPTAL